MKSFLVHDTWKIVEDQFHPEWNEIAESCCSIGNGKMGQRGTFEETFSGKSLQGNYIAGVYYPDKTRVGWWKNGYPEYFAKVLNAVNWIGLRIWIEGEELDLNKAQIINFRRELNMQDGVLSRSFIATLKNGHRVGVTSQRFYSIHEDELGALSYQIQLDKPGQVRIENMLDFDISNKDANYDEKFWSEVDRDHHQGMLSITAKTKKLDFHVHACSQSSYYLQNEIIPVSGSIISRNKYVAESFSIDLKQTETFKIEKFCITNSSFYYPKEELSKLASQKLKAIFQEGFSTHLQKQKEAWSEKWNDQDIVIEGDVAAQQGIRFNIFHLNQTYTGKDPRLNIGPKGFTGEKYGGSTYWDTEAYCLPFYLSTAEQQVARNLLVYRYKHLDKAIENAKKLGFSNGAALYPMVTMNGEECHNEWEITFEEIHRNGAIAYAIYNYIRHSGDREYLSEFGLEVLIAISRFWKQRFNFSKKKQKYVLLGVTGPNEYENNVNNNWYTIYIARWCMLFTIESAEGLKSVRPKDWEEIAHKTGIQPEEFKEWKSIIENCYFPYDPEKKIYLQQDGFLDKVIAPVSSIPSDELPINKHWSWDRILRSCFIKQADVLQGMYFFMDHFTSGEIQKHFDFYEPITVHESSLSPCIHSILAAELKKFDKAYQMYLRTARLDLDDYNDDSDDGCHITSMAGTWMSVVEGFGGMRTRSDTLSFKPFLPPQWKMYSFRIQYRKHKIKISVYPDLVKIKNLSADSVTINCYEQKVEIEGLEEKKVSIPK